MQNDAVARSGIVMRAEESARAEQVAAGVPGVAGVANELRLMTPSRKFAASKET